MKKLIRLILSVVFLFQCKIAWALTPNQLQLFSQNTNMHMMIPVPSSKAGIFSQAINHNDISDIRKFNQRYWWSTDYAKTKSAPVIIYICGESECGSGVFWGMTGAHGQVLGSYLFALEHRYYGKSQPFSDLSTASLKYLTTELALKDVVNFKRQLTAQMGLTGKWLVIGGSYAGHLAAQLRRLYPNDFAGALASSAAVRADYSMTEYDEHVGQIAGPECLANLHTVLTDVENSIISDDGFKKMKDLFLVPQMNHRGDFMYLLSDVTSASVQLGQKDQFCLAIKQKGLAGLIEMKKDVDKRYADFSRYSAEEAEKTDLASNNGSVEMRQWFYQSCTEYGFWQNASPNESLRARSKVLNADYHNELCQRLFGLAKALPVDNALKFYYNPLLEPTTSQILFTNGDRDPWLSTTITASNHNVTNPNTESILMTDALHCDDLSRGGNASVQSAKQRFQFLAKSWLNLSAK